MLGYLKEFSRKKLICAKNMTKLPALTVLAKNLEKVQKQIPGSFLEAF
jgi:hypothetical protein